MKSSAWKKNFELLLWLSAIYLSYLSIRFSDWERLWVNSLIVFFLNCFSLKWIYTMCDQHTHTHTQWFFNFKQHKPVKKIVSFLFSYLYVFDINKQRMLNEENNLYFKLKSWILNWFFFSSSSCCCCCCFMVNQKDQNFSFSFSN